MNRRSPLIRRTPPAWRSAGGRFDTVNSNFRQGGWGHTGDAGRTWTFPGVLEPGVLEPGVFRSDPVLDFDAQGNFYYYSLRLQGANFCCDMWKSTDGGVTWNAPTFAHGGDKGWVTIDRTGGPGDGHIYTIWTDNYACTYGEFAMSRDGNVSFENALSIPGSPFWGTLSVGPFGELYICGNGFTVLRSDDAQEPLGAPTFQIAWVSLGGSLRAHVSTAALNCLRLRA